MSGVNDLVERLDDGMWCAGDPADSAIDACKQEIAAIAREAWKPVSEPPTEADGDSAGELLFWFGDRPDPSIEVADWRNTPAWATHWARIRDVLLLPPEKEGE